jgi:hypothetical protein
MSDKPKRAPVDLGTTIELRPDPDRAKRFGEQVGSRDALLAPFSVETSGLVWMSVHGAICLALRHPLYKGPSRQLVLNFVRSLGEKLVAEGVLTPQELQEVTRTEQEESPHGAG